MMRNKLLCFMVFFLILPSIAMADEKRASKHLAAPTGLKVTVVDPHSIFKFNELPDDNYFFRSFTVNAKNYVRDLRDRDSDVLIRTYSQSDRGFLAKWLREGQAITSLTENTEAIMLDGSGRRSFVTLKKGESVGYDIKLNPNGKNDILFVVRCANKVTAGVIKLPPSKIAERIVEKEVLRMVPVEKIIERRVPTGDVNIFQDNRKYINITQSEKKSKKKWYVVGGVIITGGIVAGILLPRINQPSKTYPAGGVISPP